MDTGNSLRAGQGARSWPQHRSGRRGLQWYGRPPDVPAGVRCAGPPSGGVWWCCPATRSVQSGAVRTTGWVGRRPPIAPSGHTP